MSWIPFAFLSFFRKKIKKKNLLWVGRSNLSLGGRRASVECLGGFQGSLKLRMCICLITKSMAMKVNSIQQHGRNIIPKNRNHWRVLLFKIRERPPNVHNWMFPFTLCPLGDMFHQPSAKAEHPVLLFRTINAPSSLTKEHPPPKEVPIYWQFTYQETKLRLVCVSLLDRRKNIGVEGEDG